MRLGILVVLAFALRMWGIGFGLPYVYSFDEQTYINEAVKLLHGTQEPLSFANPPLFKYILAGLFDTIIGRDQLGDVDPTLLYVVARATSAALGAATVLVVYWIARRLRNRQTGLIAAALAAVAYLLVRESHFAVNDALAALCATIALAGSVRVACIGRRRDYLVAGASLGLAFAAKYQAAVMLVPLLLSHVLRAGDRRLRNLLLALAAALFVAVVAFPPMVTETQQVVGEVYAFNVLPARLGYEGLDPRGGYAFYSMALGLGVGWGLLVLAGVAVVQAGRRRDWPVLVLASVPVCLYVVMGSSRLYFARFLLPALPVIVVLAAIVLADVARRSPVLGILLAALAVAGTLPNSLQFDTLLTRVDTRTAARTWVQAHLPASAQVLAEPTPIGPPLGGLPLKVAQPDGYALEDRTPDEYRRQGIEYVVTSSFSSDAPSIDPAREARRRTFYATLASQAREVAEFVPYHGSPPGFVYDQVYGPFDSLDALDRPGPTIRIFQLGITP